jgi:hypothetical protein
MHASEFSRTSDSPLVERLREEHMRTRLVLRRAHSLIRYGAPNATVAAVARGMHAFLSYFSPLHELDEEQSVAPALRAYADSELTQNLVDRMTRDHVVLDARRARAAAAWEQVAREPSLLGRIRVDVRHDTRELARLLARHMAWEEREIFPRVRLLVPRDLQRVILDVMKGRRHESCFRATEEAS